MFTYLNLLHVLRVQTGSRKYRLVTYQHKLFNQFLPTTLDDNDESYCKLVFSLSQKC